jgi:hypothetical protein
VELFGLPGAGKTALCLALREHLETRVEIFADQQLHGPWRALGALQRKLSLALAILGRPRLSLALIALILRLELWRSARSLVFLTRLPLTRTRLTKLSRVAPMVLDQAMLQDVWSICVSADCIKPTPAILAPVVAELYRDLSVQVLYLEIDVATAAARVSQRKNGHSRFDGLPRATAALRLAHTVQLSASILESARLAGLEVYQIDAGQQPALVVDQALAVVGQGFAD